MTDPDQLNDASGALLLYAMLVIVVLVVLSLIGYCSRQTDFEPQPDLAGEHSVLVQTEE